jgi:hypothetical protein
MRDLLDIIKEGMADDLGQPNAYDVLVQDHVHKLIQAIWADATAFVEEARAAGLKPSTGNIQMPDESDVITALLEALQESGFSV